MRQPPEVIKLYHIVHCDRLASILSDGWLLCDSTMAVRAGCGTTIGMSKIKERRMRNRLASHPGLQVSDCVPFYFCPRSVMLYLLYMGNHPELKYRGGQQPIVHLQFDLHAVVDWANQNGHRWAFTLSNAGASFFEDRCDLSKLCEVNWEAVAACDWSDRDIKEGKQAEFLVEARVPWALVEEAGMHPNGPIQQVQAALQGHQHHPKLVSHSEWYY